MARATVDGLRNLRRPEDVARARGKTISEVLPLPRIPKTKPVEVDVVADVVPEVVAEAPPEVADADA
jgi:hypothetical protein